jgi:excisionase family DNA binding protein
MNNPTTPMLFPYDPNEFWEHMREIIKEEIVKSAKEMPPAAVFETKGLTYKPLLKITEVCTFFQVSRPTIYDWIKHGKLKPYRIRRSVYFLWNDIQQLLAM